MRAVNATSRNSIPPVIPDSAVRTIRSSYATLPWNTPWAACVCTFDHSSRRRRSGAGLRLCIVVIAFEVRPTRATGNRSQRILPAMATPFGDPSYRNGPSRSTDCCGPGSAVPPPSTVENAFTWMNSDSAERVS